MNFSVSLYAEFPSSGSPCLNVPANHQRCGRGGAEILVSSISFEINNLEVEDVPGTPRCRGTSAVQPGAALAVPRRVASDRVRRCLAASRDTRSRGRHPASVDTTAARPGTAGAGNGRSAQSSAPARLQSTNMAANPGTYPTNTRRTNV